MLNPLNEDFYLAMEVAINRALKNLDEEETRGFWCDGVVPAKKIMTAGRRTRPKQRERPGGKAYTLLFQ